MVSWLMVALLADARALTVLCGPAFVSEIAPRPGATDVPTDTRIALAFTGCDEEGQVDVALSILGADGEFEVVQSTRLAARAGQVAWLVPDGGLWPDSEYRVESSGETFTTTSFRTGLGASAPLTGALEAELATAEWDRRADEARMGVVAFPEPDPSGLGVVELLDPEDGDAQLSAALVSGAEQALTARWEARRKPDEICATARQVDGAGRVVGEVPICADPERVRGNCSTAPAPTWLALLGLVFLRRRRRPGEAVGGTPTATAARRDRGWQRGFGTGGFP